MLCDLLATVSFVYVFSWGACLGIVLGGALCWQAVRLGWVRP